MRVVHYCAGLEECNGMANVARMLVCEQKKSGHDALLTNKILSIRGHIDEVWVHGAWRWGTWVATMRGLRLGAKVIRMPHGSYDPVRRAYHGWKKSLVGLIERHCLRKADVVVATCESEKAWIIDYEPDVKRVELQDIKRFFHLDTCSLPTMRGNDTSLHILYLGRRHPLKGVDCLVEALEQLHGALRYEFRVVDGAFGERKEKFWDWCDVLVLPTLSENFGLVIAEALERGKRVITTDGAPAWSPSASATEDKGDGHDYGGRLTYIKGYRDGTKDERVRLLAAAIRNLAKSE